MGELLHEDGPYTEPVFQHVKAAPQGRDVREKIQPDAEKHELYLSDGFSNALSSMACAWHDFIGGY